MNIEIEARYYAIDELRTIDLLGEYGTCEFFRSPMRRVVWQLDPLQRSFLRVREGDGAGTEITIKTIKDGRAVDGTYEKNIKLHGRKLKEFRNLFKELGLGAGSYQETRRSLWRWNDIEGATVTIDYWPGLEPLLEIEAQHHQIATIANILDLSERFQGDIAELYNLEHGMTLEELNKIPELTDAYFLVESPLDQ